MALQKKPLHTLEHFLPEGTYEQIIPYLNHYHIRLKITKERRTKYGDYKPGQRGHAHEISINGNLNPYHFLLTLVHELAHLVAFDRHGFRIKSHGHEWKKTYHELMIPFLNRKVFPEKLLTTIMSSMTNIKSSSCYNPTLSLALRQYDRHPLGTMIQDIAIGGLFATADGRQYKLLSKRRTRFEAIEIDTGKTYLFPALYEVEKL